MNNENKKSDTSEREEDNSLTDVIDSLEPETKQAIFEQTLFMAFGQHSPESSISKKMTEEHISKFLEDSGENMRLSYKESNSKRWFLMGVFVIIMSFLVLIVITFKNNPDFIEKAFYALGGLVAGAFGGFGLGKSKRDD